jgi:arylsulfatase A-like enzyme
MDTTISDNGKGFVNYKGRYQTRVYGELSEEIIRHRVPSDQPFFYHLSFTAPHNGGPIESDDPGVVRGNDGVDRMIGTPARPSDVRGDFDAAIPAAPGASWLDPDFGDKPGYLRTLPLLNSTERTAIRDLTRQRAEALSVVDAQVRRIIDALAASGELSRTLVLFTSDNGYFLGEQRMRDGKKWPHEPSLRVPLLMRGPGIPAGATRTDPFMSIDFAPTLAAAAGLELPWRVDGRSMLAVARNGDVGWTRGVLVESGPYDKVVRDTDLAGNPLTPGEAADIRYTIGLRTPRYLYVDVATGEEELYDVVADPLQYDNLARDDSHADVLRLLRVELRRLRACAGTTCRAPLVPGLTTMR